MQGDRTTSRWLSTVPIELYSEAKLQDYKVNPVKRGQLANLTRI
jgi:hypothetical protein